MPKLYVDSRARKDGSDSDFTIELPRPINLDVPHLCSFDQVAIPNVFKPIDTTNNRIYIYERAVTIPIYNQVETWRMAIIEPGHYSVVSLAAAVQTALNAQTTLTDNYSVGYDATKNRLFVSNLLSVGGAFAIWGNAYLKTHIDVWNGNSLSQVTIDTMKHSGWAVGFQTDQSNYHTSSAPLYADSAPNLQRHHTLFVHSPDLTTTGDSYGPLGQSGIVRRIVNTASPNDIILDQHSTAFDTLRLPRGCLTTLRFSLKGYDNQLADLNGHPWSFALCFYPDDE